MRTALTAIVFTVLLSFPYWVYACPNGYVQSGRVGER